MPTAEEILKKRQEAEENISFRPGKDIWGEEPWERLETPKDPEDFSDFSDKDLPKVSPAYEYKEYLVKAVLEGGTEVYIVPQKAIKLFGDTPEGVKDPPYTYDQALDFISGILLTIQEKAQHSEKLRELAKSQHSTPEQIMRTFLKVDQNTFEETEGVREDIIKRIMSLPLKQMLNLPKNTMEQAGDVAYLKLVEYDLGKHIGGEEKPEKRDVALIDLKGKMTFLVPEHELYQGREMELLVSKDSPGFKAKQDEIYRKFQRLEISKEELENQIRELYQNYGGTGLDEAKQRWMDKYYPPEEYKPPKQEVPYGEEIEEVPEEALEDLYTALKSQNLMKEAEEIKQLINSLAK